MMEKTRILLAGDSAVSVQFGDAIDPEIYARVRALYESLKGEKISGVTELIPTFRSLMVQYDPRRLGYGQLKGQLEARLEKLGRAQHPPKKVITIPVCFGGSWGEDLEEYIRFASIGPEEYEQIRRQVEEGSYRCQIREG